MTSVRRIVLIAALLGSVSLLSGCGLVRTFYDRLFQPQELTRMDPSREDSARRPGVKPPLGLVPGLPGSERFLTVRRSQLPRLNRWLAPAGLRAGHPVYLRLYKQEGELELWMAEDASGQGRYRLLRTFDICRYSGELGPKRREGDGQSPEGFYQVGRQALNPNSAYHLSFNLGFPNALDQALGRTGSFLMVHGGCDSIGCYAMTDPVIEIIYTLMYEALAADPTPVPVHIFPFRRTRANLLHYADHPDADFWVDLFQADIAFERSQRPPTMEVDLASRRYRLPAALQRALAEAAPSNSDPATALPPGTGGLRI